MVAPRLTRDLSAVYPEEEKNSLLLAVGKCIVACLSLQTFFTQGISVNNAFDLCIGQGSGAS